MGVSGNVQEWKDLLLLVSGIVVFSLASIAVFAIIGEIYTPVARRYGIRLPIWLGPVASAVVIVVLYPAFGAPVAERYFRHETSRRKLEKQFLWGIFVLPVLTIVVETVALYVLKAVISSDPTVSLFPSWGVFLVWVGSFFGTVLGVPCALGLHLFRAWFRSRNRGPSMEQ